jgi:hypothetical protein
MRQFELPHRRIRRYQYDSAGHIDERPDVDRHDLGHHDADRTFVGRPDGWTGARGVRAALVHGHR